MESNDWSRLYPKIHQGFKIKVSGRCLYHGYVTDLMGISGWVGPAGLSMAGKHPERPSEDTEYLFPASNIKTCDILTNKNKDFAELLQKEDSL